MSKEKIIVKLTLSVNEVHVSGVAFWINFENLKMTIFYINSKQNTILPQTITGETVNNKQRK